MAACGRTAALRNVPSLLMDRDLVLAAVSQTSEAIYWVPMSYRDDRGVMKAAVRDNHHTLQCASKELQKDREMRFIAFGSCLSKQPLSAALGRSQTSDEILALVNELLVEPDVDKLKIDLDAAIDMLKHVKGSALEKQFVEAVDDVCQHVYAPDGIFGKRDRAAFEADQAAGFRD